MQLKRNILPVLELGELRERPQEEKNCTTGNFMDDELSDGESPRYVRGLQLVVGTWSHREVETDGSVEAMVTMVLKVTEDCTYDWKCKREVVRNHKRESVHVEQAHGRLVWCFSEGVFFFCGVGGFACLRFWKTEPNNFLHFKTIRSHIFIQSH
jgi:hypothetical protein